MGCQCFKSLEEANSTVINLKEAINNNKKLCIWILGGPGSGKGTQCKMLAEHFKLAHLSTGDLLREVTTKNTPLAEKIKVTMANGDLVDTPTVLELLTGAMIEAYPNCNGYLIDGYPREVEQGLLFCKKIGIPHVIIFLDCPDHILVQRLLQRGKESGRVDDNEETIKVRRATFHKVSEPVIDHWKYLVVNVDASLSPLEVKECCVQAIVKCQEGLVIF